MAANDTEPRFERARTTTSLSSSAVSTVQQSYDDDALFPNPVIYFNVTSFLVQEGEISIENTKARRIYVQTTKGNESTEDGDAVVQATLNTTKAHITSIVSHGGKVVARKTALPRGYEAAGHSRYKENGQLRLGKSARAEMLEANDNVDPTDDSETGSTAPFKEAEFTFEGIIGGDVIADIGGQLELTSTLSEFQGAYSLQTSAPSVIVAPTVPHVSKGATKGFIGSTQNCNAMKIGNDFEAVDGSDARPIRPDSDCTFQSIQVDATAGATLNFNP
eukprot:SAG31_NODE_1125_length_9770_cov_2.732499_9_plen_276_part_00